MEEILAREGEAAAPDLLVFEVLAVLRRHVRRGSLAKDRGLASPARRYAGIPVVELAAPS